ncbi:DUF501 domain-containing protein [Brevibacterium sp. 91QC2O2]|uniref:DUF501 domain-containing protein n=1 Tax=Brevibacterium TaxID=1696 RepID=UPI00211C1EEE|nr:MULTISPECIES: DUF501 domain-containing protein [unclassified Brevibacterium]MCQ9369206.1 DUF501 domain-containing protein [Brevibacterium sp. 91QC2O2]MCQ9386793.1 DUF501 domain-containing protein [Brevibacterium sp. 68QC2CO]
MITPATQADLDVVHEQLGRIPRGVVGIAARAVDGTPLVVATAPRLPDGTPFPTSFYLSHPAYVAEASRLEAAGTMAEWTRELGEDADLAAAYANAHRDYLDRRAALGRLAGTDDVPEIKDFSAGGMPVRVKCLHALVGHALAAGPGVNPIGDRAISLMTGVPAPAQASATGAAVPDPTAAAPASDDDARAEAVSSAVRVAAIDCGTNSIRLLIADIAAGRLSDVVREMRIVRLGQGVDRTGAFAPEALERTFAACEEYARLIADHGAQRVRFVATSASRDAANREEFFAGVRERLGVDPEVITGVAEAGLSFLGATATLGTGQDAPAAPYLVMDLGGGSTELVTGTREVDAAFSMDIGCVRLTERLLRSDPPSAAEVEAAQAAVDAWYDRALETVDVSGTRTIVGVAGTVTTVAAAVLGLEAYDRAAIHGARLDLDDTVATCAELTAMPRAQRAGLGFMHPGRVDVIGAGALIFSRLLQRISAQVLAATGSAPVVMASEADILDGTALRLGQD